MVDVYLHDRLVGSIGYANRALTVFSFERTYLEDPRRPTLSQSMLDASGEPRTPRRSMFGRLPAYFANLLPEGRLRTYLAERGNVDEDDDMALLATLGEDLPGAVVVRAGGERPPFAPLRPTAARIAGPMHFSLAGVQLKFSALGNDESKGLTISAAGVGGNWIVKLPSRRFDRLPQAEAAVMTFAALSGIDVPAHRIVPLEEIRGLPGGVADAFGPAYAIRRYDRATDGSRIHQEDFAQVVAAYPSDKYKIPSCVPMVHITAQACGEDDAQEFVRRLVFNAGVGNGDAHLKNFSLLYRDGVNPRLSPGYDFVPTRRYVSADQIAIPVVETRRWERIRIDEFDALAMAAGLSRHRTRKTVDETVDRMHDAWPRMRDCAWLDEETAAAVSRQMKSVPLFGGSAPSRVRPPRARKRRP